MSVSAGKILDHVRGLRDDFVNCLIALTRDESPSLNPESIERIQRALRRRLAMEGFRVHHIPGDRSGGQLYSVPIQRRRGAPYQLILGHCDTVWPEGSLSTMPIAVNETRLRGPGVFDMKGGLAQIIFALRTMRELGLEPEVTPIVMITSDEEVGSIESERHIERFARCARRAYVLEPALGLDGRLKTARKGTGHFDVTVVGRASHAGIAPEEGASAILEMSHVIQRLFSLNDPARGITVNVGTVAGGLRSNVIAPESRAGVDVRVLTEEDAHDVEDYILNIQPVTEDVTVKIEGSISRSPMEATDRNQALWNLARQSGIELGLVLQQGTSGGVSDGNITSLFTATLDGLGAVGDGAHAHREYINIDRTLERCALLVLLLMAPADAGA